MAASGNSLSVVTGEEEGDNDTDVESPLLSSGFSSLALLVLSVHRSSDDKKKRQIQSFNPLNLCNVKVKD